MNDDLTSQSPSATVFEQIRRQTPEGREFWSSRDLARVLAYTDYRNFDQVIGKAKLACFKSGQRVDDHFVDVTEMVDIGSGAQRQRAIRARKRLKKSQQILDHMGSTELAANLFRATQTEEKLRRDCIKGKAAANRTHKEVGAKVRQTIQEIGGAMPENLPTEESIKAVERRVKRQQRIEAGTESSE